MDCRIPRVLFGQQIANDANSVRTASIRIKRPYGGLRALVRRQGLLLGQEGGTGSSNIAIVVIESVPQGVDCRIPRVLFGQQIANDANSVRTASIRIKRPYGGLRAFVRRQGLLLGQEGGTGSSNIRIRAIESVPQGVDCRIPRVLFGQQIANDANSVRTASIRIKRPYGGLRAFVRRQGLLLGQEGGTGSSNIRIRAIESVPQGVDCRIPRVLFGQQIANDANSVRTASIRIKRPYGGLRALVRRQGLLLGQEGGTGSSNIRIRAIESVPQGVDCRIPRVLFGQQIANDANSVRTASIRIKRPYGGLRAFVRRQGLLLGQEGGTGSSNIAIVVIESVPQGVDCRIPRVLFGQQIANDANSVRTAAIIRKRPYGGLRYERRSPDIDGISHLSNAA